MTQIRLAMTPEQRAKLARRVVSPESLQMFRDAMAKRHCGKSPLFQQAGALKRR